jgi:large subunit ribosomal protein L17
MNKKVFGRKLSRSRPAREALFSALSRAMILSGKIVTTHAKAKAIQGEVERFVTLAKKGDLSSRRRALARLDNAKDALDGLFKNVAPAFANRQSGFTRIISLPRRTGDNAKMVRMEWTETIVNSEKRIENSSKPGKKEVKKTESKSKKLDAKP